MTNRNIYLFVAFIALCSICTACKQERGICLTPKIAKLFVDTRHLAVDTSTVFTDTVLSSAVFVAFTSDSARGFGYLQQLASFTLSLSPDTNFCQWGFRTDTAGNTYDTISFYYQRNRQFISNACGFADFYTIDSVRTTHTMIDSIHVFNKSVTNNVNTTHQVQLYIHPDF